MSNQPRVTKILVSLVIAMTAAAIVLMILDNQGVSGGAFSLTSYSSLGSVKQVIATKTRTRTDRWDRIEVFYSKTGGGNLKQLASISGLTSTEDLNFHFLVYNGLGGVDGQIVSTKKWKRQWSALPGGSWYGNDRTIRICIIGDGRKTTATGSQLTRAAEVIETLNRKYQIATKNIQYPADWPL